YTSAGSCPAIGHALAPATSCTLEVSFTPKQTGPRNGNVSVATTATALPLNAVLTGTGIQSELQIAPGALSFGSIATGSSANLTLRLTNNGTANVSNLALAVTGDYAVTVPCQLTLLAPDQSCTVTITFTPTATGARNGSLTVTSSDSSSPATIPLTGTGVPNGSFTLAVNGADSSSASEPYGVPASYGLTITPVNGFSGTVVLNCAPIAPGVYATCSLSPSSVNIAGSAQNATATINTITKVNMNAPSQSAHIDPTSRAFFCLFPAALLFFWKSRKTRSALRRTAFVWIVLFSATTILLLGCGSGGDPSLRYTP